MTIRIIHLFLFVFLSIYCQLYNAYGNQNVDTKNQITEKNNTLPINDSRSSFPDSFVIYYSDKAEIAEFDDYKLLILDSDYHPPLRPLSNKGKMLLGYISLGEVEQQRTYFNAVKSDGILLQENEQWKGSYFVDVRDAKWADRVITKLIPAILRQGFDGIFLDTLDNAAELERRDPKKYHGMTKAAANLVMAIRLHYPNIKIMLNRGYELLPQVASHINMALGESVYTDYDFKTKTYQLVPTELYHKQVKILNDAKKLNSQLKIYTLDYWNEDDAKGIADIYLKQQNNGFIPYVSIITLDKIIKKQVE